MRRTNGLATALGLALTSLGVGCTLVAGVGDYAVGTQATDAGGMSAGDATPSPDAARHDAAPHDAARDAGADATNGDGASSPEAATPATCGIDDAGTPIDLCTGTATPVPLTTFTSSSPAVAIVSDGTNVYWSDGTTIWSCAVGGCANEPTTFFSASIGEEDAGSTPPIVDIALDSMNVYWAGSPAGLITHNVTSCLKSGCGATLLMSYGSDVVPATGVASDGINVFWTDVSGVHTCPVTGCDTSIPVVGSGKAAPGVLSLGSKYVYWVDVNLGQLVHNAKGDLPSNVTSPAGSEVSASFVPTATGSSQLVTTGVGVYWASPFALNLCTTDALTKFAACTAGPTRVGPVFAAPPSECRERSTTNIPITTDGVNVYYAAPTGAGCSGQDALVKCTPQGACTVLSPQLPAETGVLAADTRNVYWVDPSGGSPIVMSIPHS
jgi:hypothetical protein